MYSLFETLNDKAGGIYLPEEEFDALANLAYNDLIEDECKKLEVDAKHTSKILQLYKDFNKQNSRQIDFPADINDFRYPVRFSMKYNKTCNGETVLTEVPVRKAPNNNVDEMQRDPFNKGIDDDPTYTPTRILSSPNVSFFVHSDSVPVNLELLYVRNPHKIDSKNNPNTVFELPDYVAEEVVDLTAKKHLGIIENFNRVAAEAQEINQRK